MSPSSDTIIPANTAMFLPYYDAYVSDVRHNGWCGYLVVERETGEDVRSICLGLCEFATNNPGHSLVVAKERYIFLRDHLGRDYIDQRGWLRAHEDCKTLHLSCIVYFSYKYTCAHILMMLSMFVLTSRSSFASSHLQENVYSVEESEQFVWMGCGGCVPFRRQL